MKRRKMDRIVNIVTNEKEENGQNCEHSYKLCSWY